MTPKQAVHADFGRTDDLSEILADPPYGHPYRQSAVNTELYQSDLPIQPDQTRGRGFGGESVQIDLCSAFRSSNPPLRFDPGPPGLYFGVFPGHLRRSPPNLRITRP